MTTVIKGKLVRSDVAVYDGVEGTVSRRDSVGGAITSLPVGLQVDVLQAYGRGVSYTRSTIQDAVNKIGSRERTLTFNPGTWVIDGNLTIPSNLTSHIPAGCVFDVASGITLTFNGPIIRESETWTSGSGTVTYTASNNTLVHDADLSDTSNVLRGDALVGCRRTETGARNSTVHEFNDYRRIIAYVDFNDVDPTGVADSLAGLQAIADAGQLGELSPGIYRISDTLEIGDGTTTTISTNTGMGFIGYAGGVGEGEFGSPRHSVKFLYAGTAGGTLVRINGPIHSTQLKNILLDGADLAGVCLDLVHPYSSRFEKLFAVRYRSKAYHLRTIAAPLFSGITQGAMDNTFIQLMCNDPENTSAHGIHLNGNETNNVGCSRNTFIGCKFGIGGAAGSNGIRMEYCDNNLFMECLTFWTGVATSGSGVHFVPATNTLFPHENAFYNCPIVGGVSGTSGTGGNIFIPYPISDSEPIPTDDNVIALLPDGRMRGRWSGSKLMWAGNTDAGTGLAQALRYFAPQGVSSGQTTISNNRQVLPSGVNLRRLRVRLDTAPGAGTSRTFTVMRNSVATALAITFGEAETGDKVDTETSLINCSGGDFLEIRSDVSGTPANSQATWALEFYPLEK